jgi:hypothetical protein
MDDKEKSPGYEVGFGKPPAARRFQRGQSGNPKGRPKGTRNAGTVIMRALEAKVVMNESGRRREVTKFEAAVTQVANKAAGGDLRALNLITALMRSAEESVQQEAATTTRLQDVDQRVLQNLMKRLEATEEEHSDAESNSERQDD